MLSQHHWDRCFITQESTAFTLSKFINLSFSTASALAARILQSLGSGPISTLGSSTAQMLLEYLNADTRSRGPRREGWRISSLGNCLSPKSGARAVGDLPGPSRVSRVTEVPLRSVTDLFSVFEIHGSL